MVKETRRRRLRELKKKLIKNYISSDCNSIGLSESDFHDDKLTSDGYEKLRKCLDHSSAWNAIELTIPLKYKESLPQDIETYISPEIVHLAKEKRRIIKTAILLLLIGSLIFIPLTLWEGRLFFSEMAVVIFWVFVWGATDRFFIQLPGLKRAEYKLLLLADAEIICKTQRLNRDTKTRRKLRRRLNIL